MSDDFQRNQAEKELILLEIQMLKQQAKASGSLAFMGQEEKDHWNRLLDSNMRAGTMACMWCMKAQLVKKTSLAFHKWKFAVARVTWNRSASPTKLNNSSNGLHSTATVDRQNSKSGPMSAVLANAISLVHHLKENEVESNINTKLFMSPSASVNAANAAATSVLQYDLNNLGNPAEQSTESLEAYNKQRLAYVLRSLHENTQAEPARQHSLNLDGSRRGDGSGINLSTEEGLDAYLRSALLSNDADSETKRQILLALSHTVATRPLTGSLPLRDPQVANRSSLSLLKGVAGSKPTPGSSQPARGRTNSRSLSPNARMHSRTRMLNNSTMSPDSESVHFFSASDVDPQSLPSSRGASIHLDGRPQRDQREQRDHRDHRDGGYHATDYHGIGAAKGGYMEHADSFGSGNPARSYPPASYNSQQSTLLPSGQRSESASSGKRGPQQQQVPRYLMPTNSYRKKRTSLPESARSSGSNRRSRSPTMITNSNSKHAVNVFGSNRHSPTAAVAYTVKEGISRSRSTTPNGTQRSASVSLSYGDLTFADYQQRKGGESGRRPSQSTPYANNTQGQQGQQGSPQHTTAGSFLDSVTQGIADYYASPPQPPVNMSGQRSHSQAGGRGGQPIHLPLPPVALSLPDASYFMHPPPPPAPEQVYQQYDAYHSSTLRTNSADIHDAQYNHHQGNGHGDAYQTAFAGSNDALMDEDVILHSGFQHAPVRGDVYHQQMPVLPYVATQQHTLQPSAHDASQAPQAPNARRKSRNNGNSHNPGGKEKPREMDKAQLELMMHGDVYDRPASWYKSLRNK